MITYIIRIIRLKNDEKKYIEINFHSCIISNVKTVYNLNFLKISVCKFELLFFEY